MGKVCIGIKSLGATSIKILRDSEQITEENSLNLGKRSHCGKIHSEGLRKLYFARNIFG